MTIYRILRDTKPTIKPKTMCPITCSNDIPLTSNGLPITYDFGRWSPNIGNSPIIEKAAESPA